MTFLSEEEYERVKNAYGARGLREGFPSLNDFMCDAILRAVADLEERFNDGKSFTREQTRRRSR